MATITEASMKIGEQTFGFTVGSDDKIAFRLTRSDKILFIS